MGCVPVMSYVITFTLSLSHSPSSEPHSDDPISDMALPCTIKNGWHSHQRPIAGTPNSIVRRLDTAKKKKMN